MNPQGASSGTQLSMSKDLEESRLMNCSPTFLFNKLPVELLAMIFEEAILQHLDHWNHTEFVTVLRATFLTCFRIRSALKTDRKIHRSIAAVFTTHYVNHPRFPCVFAASASFSCNTLDYVDLSALQKPTTREFCTVLGRYCYLVKPSAGHLKVLKLPLRPIWDDFAILFLLHDILRNASKLVVLWFRVLHLDPITSEILHATFVEAAPRIIHLVVDLGRGAPTESLYSFYAHLCRKAVEVKIEFHMQVSSATRRQELTDRALLPTRILESASSTVRRVKIATNGLVSQLKMPASLPLLEELEVEADLGLQRPLIDSPAGIWDLPALQHLNLSASWLPRIQAPNVATATLMLRGLHDGTHVGESLSKWPNLTSLVLVVTEDGSRWATRGMTIVLESLMASRGKPLRCSRLEYLNVTSVPSEFILLLVQHATPEERLAAEEYKLQAGLRIVELEAERRRFSEGVTTSTQGDRSDDGEDKDVERSQSQDSKEKQDDQWKDTSPICKPLNIDDIRGWRLDEARALSSKAPQPPDHQTAGIN